MSTIAGRQLALFGRTPPRHQFLKWVGSKHRHAGKIVDCMPSDLHRYIEPFVGSGSVLATVAPADGIAGDALGPLIDIWQLLQSDPDILLAHYGGLFERYLDTPREVYEEVREHYNGNPNGPDLLFLCRTCYGGVVRFTREGAMSTPVGPHRAISPGGLAERIDVWRARVANTSFVHGDFEETMAQAGEGDIVYCDPPYVHSQAILYGSQDFLLDRLWRVIEGCRDRGARVILSLDGMKKSGQVHTVINAPEGLFERDLMLDCGRSMLRRFQKKGQDMTGEQVHDRLLLTW
jgi:DNA adenine methylase